MSEEKLRGMDERSQRNEVRQGERDGGREEEENAHDFISDFAKGTASSLAKAGMYMYKSQADRQRKRER